jgi:hypothetical protein
MIKIHHKKNKLEEASIRKIQKAKRAINEQIEFLKYSSGARGYEVRMQIIEGFGDSINHGMLLLENFLKDRNELVRITAVQELEILDSRWDAKNILERLRDPSPLVRGDSALALSNFKSFPIRSEISSSLRDEKDPEAKVRMELALYYMGDRRMLSRLRNRMSDENYRVRITTARVWARFCHRKDISMLRKVLMNRKRTEKSIAVIEAINDGVKILKS